MLGSMSCRSMRIKVKRASVMLLEWLTYKHSDCRINLDKVYFPFNILCGMQSLVSR